MRPGLYIGSLHGYDMLASTCAFPWRPIACRQHIYIYIYIYIYILAMLTPQFPCHDTSAPRINGVHAKTWTIDRRTTAITMWTEPPSTRLRTSLACMSWRCRVRGCDVSLATHFQEVRLRLWATPAGRQGGISCSTVNGFYSSSGTRTE